jgi:PLP dependent protein
MTQQAQVDVQTIARRLEWIRERIAGACRRVGRMPDAVTLIAVTKTFSPQVAAAARHAGLKDLGENRVQELVEKTAMLPGRVQGGDLLWHMIGHLQRNKAKDVVERADFFHGLDSLRLASELDRRAGQMGRVLPCMLQVNVSGESSKFGLEPVAVPAFLDEVVRFEHLRIKGLMTLAAPAGDPEEVRPQFRLLRSLADACRARQPGVSLDFLSMGMSGDFEVAIEEGATHIRLGSAVFGTRYD